MLFKREAEGFTNDERKGRREEEKDGGEGADAGRWLGAERGRTQTGDPECGVGWGGGGAEYEIDAEEGGSYEAGLQGSLEMVTMPWAGQETGWQAYQ